jgi:hypothetical protein
MDTSLANFPHIFFIKMNISDSPFLPGCIALGLPWNWAFREGEGASRHLH